MRAGRLRHRLSLQSPTHANTVGTITTTWGTVATIWGSIEPLRVFNREFYSSAVINAEISATIIIRYTADIEPDYRIVFETRIFEIMWIINVDEKDKEMQLMVKEEVIR